MAEDREVAEPGPSQAHPDEDTGVSNLELFFDLVFVFAITQLTAVLVHEPNRLGLLRATLELGVLWWMYGGYAWLTNAVPPRRTADKLLVLVGMGGFLVVALAIPTAFNGSGVAFGVGYLIVTSVHAGLFMRTGRRATFLAVLRLAPFNLLSAGLILVAGFLHGTAALVLWGAAFVLEWCTPYLSRISGFTVRTRHFVERHGLVILIALGESTLAVGIGAAGHLIGARLIVAGLLDIAVSAAMWWMFFDGENERAEQALAAADADRRPWLSLYAFGYTFLLLLGGIVLLAAGLKLGLRHPDEALPTAGAWFIAGGVSLYLAGMAVFRRLLRIGRTVVRWVAALVVLATVPLGRAAGAEAQMAVILVLLVATLVLESRMSGDQAPQRRTES